MNKTRTIIILLAIHSISLSSYAQNIKPYHEIITKEATTQKGDITTHLVDTKLYFEIPTALLHKDFLFVQPIKADYKQVRFEKKGSHILLYIPQVRSEVGNILLPKEDHLDSKSRMATHNEKKYGTKIIAARFPIVSKGLTDSSFLIDATSMFLRTPKELPGGWAAVVNNDASIIKLVNKDHVIDVETSKTVTSSKGDSVIEQYFSLVLLPDPMMPRLWDIRMGFGKEHDYLSTRIERAAITRWRLEKKFPSQAVSEPIKPIVLYYDPAMPKKWQPFVKAGVEQWITAFEAAGFKNAIVVKEPPIHDKNFSVHSMRYSFIRWTDKTHYRGKEDSGSGTVSKIIDERTGEILKGDVLIGGNYVLLADRYFVRCAHLDKRAQQYPFPDDLMGEMIKALTAHETGHLFGLKDGNYGEYAYPFEKMRDKKWLGTMGHTPSMMNYARENHLIQPEDNMPLELLHQKVGPTDLYSIRWGYTPFSSAQTPDEELPYLEKIIREQDSIPWYRFIEANSYYNPQNINEVVESNDPIKSAELGTKNLKRVMDIIPNATLNDQHIELKNRLHYKVLAHWVNQMKYVVSLVGGYTFQHKSRAQEGGVYTPIPAKRQREAVAFLNENAFQPTLWMVPDGLLGRIEPYGGKVNNKIKIISERQIKVLKELLSQTRLKQLEETTLTEQNAYTITDLLKDLNNGIWQELNTKDLKIDPYRQEIQLAYITILNEAINAEGKRFNARDIASNKYTYSNYIRGTMLKGLQDLKSNIQKALKKVKDPSTKVHLELCLLELDETQKRQNQTSDNK